MSGDLWRIDLDKFVSNLILSTEDLQACRSILEAQMVSPKQILEGEVTMDDLRDEGMPESALTALKESIDKYTAELEEKVRISSLTAG